MNNENVGSAHIATHSNVSGQQGAPPTVANEQVAFNIERPTPTDRVELTYQRPMTFTPVPYHSTGATVGLVLSTTSASSERAMDEMVEWVERRLRDAARRALDNHRQWCQEMGVRM